jgi:hypothetical protein
LRGAGWVLAVAAAVLAIPILLLVLAVGVAVIGLVLTLLGLSTAATEMTSGYTAWIAALFSPSALPTIIPRLALFALLVALVTLVFGAFRGALSRGPHRRSRQAIAGRLLGGPLSSSAVADRCAAELWNLIRGAAALPTPPRAELGRRYLDLLAENLGQPGFRELLVTIHDMDARRDLVFALLDPRLRPRYFTRPSVGPGARSGAAAPVAAPAVDPSEAASRQLEAFDLAGAARDHVLDAMDAALALPLAVDPHLLTFAPEGPWRGETHRVCDRPGSLARLLEEVAAAGAEQVILVTASPPSAQPHELSAGRGDLRGRAGEQLAGFESATLRDALEQFSGRFAGLFVIRPTHNPLGPLDFRGAYDERSDRTHTLDELLDRGYEEAYRQFIEPVVGASGDKMTTTQLRADS